MAPPSILIIGCGVAGPVLATFLLLAPGPAQDKPHITIVERSAAAHSYGQNIDIRGAGVTVIRKLGLETAIRNATTREEGVHFVDGSGRVLAVNPTDKTGKIQTGTSDIEILRGRLCEIVFGRCREVSEEVQRNWGRGVEFVFGETVEGMEQDGDGVSVVFSKSKAKRKFDIVVGADGLMSTTRRTIWGRETDEEKLYRIGMYSAFFSMPSTATDSLWRRWYTAPRRRNIMIRPSDRPDRVTVLMFVANESDERLDRVAKLSYGGVEAQKGLMEEYFGDAGWECERCVEGMWKAEDFYFNLVAQVRMEGWGRGRVVLLGDAAWCPSPFSGMGTTTALQGAYHLGGALTRHNFDPEASFAAYEATMRPTIQQAQKMAPWFAKLIAPETMWGVWALRTFAMVVAGLASLLLPVLSLVVGEGRPEGVPMEEYGYEEVEDRVV